VFLVRLLSAAGLRLSDITLIKVDNDAGLAALQSGGIDAWATWDPFAATAENAGFAVELANGEGYYSNYVVLFGRSDYVRNYPETVKQFLTAYRAGLDWVNANHEAALSLFTEVNKLAPEVAKLTFEHRNYQLATPDSQFLADSKEQAQILLQVGGVKKEPDWTTAVNTALAKEVLG
jgi:sulfonate transport system substrate-binding protein